MILDKVIDFDLYVLDHAVQPVIDWLGRRWGVDFIKLGTNIGYTALSIAVVQAGLFVHAHQWLNAVTVLIGTAPWPFIFHQMKISARSNTDANRYYAIFTRMVMGLMTCFSLLTDSLVASLQGTLLPTSLAGTLYLALLSLALYILSCKTPPPKEKREKLLWFRPEPQPI